MARDLLPPPPPSVPQDSAPLVPQPPGGDSDDGNNDDPTFFAALATPLMATHLLYPPERNAALLSLLPHPNLDGRAMYSDGRRRTFMPCLHIVCI